jgi:hypothetical protein
MVITALADVGVSAFAFVLYLRTLAPTIMPYGSPDLLDVPMLQMQICVLGMAHPTGYPSYLMLSHLFTYLPFGDCGYLANLASATFAALAVVAVFATGYLLGRRVAAAAAAALVFGLGGAVSLVPGHHRRGLHSERPLYLPDLARAPSLA